MAQGSGMSGMSGMTEEEASGFNKMFIASFLGFTLVAAIAHYAAWQWRPWIPGVSGYTASANVAPATTTTASHAVAYK